MNPSSKFFLSFFGRIKYAIVPIIIISIVVYFITKGYYEELPRYFICESKIFPINEGNKSAVPDNPFFTSSKASSTDFYNLGELLRSRTIREEISKRVIYLNGEQQYIFQQAIEDFNNNPDHRGKLKVGNDINENIINGGKALVDLLGIVTDESNFVKLITKSYNEDFAVALGNVEIDVLSDFYVKFNQKPLNNNFLAVSRTKDSLEYELDRYETAYAKYLDENKFIVKQEQNITEKRLLRKLTSIETALATVTANYYASKSEVDENKPILKVLDRPKKPLKLDENDKKTYPIAWGILSFLVLIIFTSMDIIVRYIRDSIALQKQRLISQES